MVTKTSDTADGNCTPTDCSLREAVIAANGSPGPDTIELQSGQAYTLSFGTAGEDQSLGGDLDIHDSVTITGTLARAAETVVKGGAGWGDRIFHVFAGANVSINGVTIQSGNAGAAAGGGILNQGTLALDASAVSGNTAAGGGGILNQGTLTLNRSTVSGNTASGANGGGILNQGTLTLTNSTISGNTASSGGGLANSSAATLSSVTIAANTATSGSAGGLLNATGQTIALKNSLIADNHGAAAPDCAGALS
jgi:CSLREA domain-containing protein